MPKFFFLLMLILFSACTSHNPRKADTRSNKRLFTNVVGFKPPPDVKGIYGYVDELGFDGSYWLAFKCNDTTVERIRAQLRLEETGIGRGMFGGLNSSPTKWWDTTFIFKSVYHKTDDEKNYWYLWYDTLNKKAYLLYIFI